MIYKPLIAEKDFLVKYNLSKADYAKTGFTWEQLTKIHDHYLKNKFILEAPVNNIISKILKCEKVHLFRYRLKDSEHLIDKIIRKKIQNANREITFDNYTTEIGDLIGVRAIHLYKDDWAVIDEYIKATWDLDGKPVANLRDGDSEAQRKMYESKGCDIAEHDRGYRSVHYTIETVIDKNKFKAEIQVRTIFEEGWSEIDHNICYPNNLNNSTITGYLLIFNRVAGLADEMGSYIKNLQTELNEKDAKINDLILKSKLSDKEKEDLRKQLSDFRYIDKQYPFLRPLGQVMDSLDLTRKLATPLHEREIVKPIGERLAKIPSKKI